MKLERISGVLGHPAAGAVCRLILGGIFVYASYPKLMDPGNFARLVYGYRVIHPDLVNLVGVTFPWLEAVAGALLVVGILPRSSALVLAGLLGVFMAAGLLALLRGLEISCGCFFPFMGDEELGWDLMVRDGLLLLLAAQIWVWPSSFLPFRKRQQ